MPDITITPANVLQSTNGSKTEGIAGATILQGQVVYLDPASQTYKLADSNGTAPANSVSGIALTGASAGQPLLVCIKDPSFSIGGTVASGASVFLSDTPGAMTAAESEVLTGSTKIFLGVGIGGNKIIFSPVTGGTV